MFRRVDSKQIWSLDWLLVISMLLLLSIGLGVIYSAGYDPQTGTSKPMIKQAWSMGIGMLFFIVCILINPVFWRRSAWVFYAAGCALLVAVLEKGVVAGGARRWLDIGDHDSYEKANAMGLKG